MFTVLIKIPFTFIHSYLKRRKQSTKINSSYGAFAEIIFTVPQGFILWPFLFNIYICDLLLENSDIDIANYADDKSTVCPFIRPWFFHF